MKRTVRPTLTIVLLVALLTNSCADWRGGDRGYNGGPRLTEVSTSDCHTYTDTLATKDMNTDSVVIAYFRQDNTLRVTHYNMPLDCGSGSHIINTITQSNDTVTVVEHVGEQGLTDCVCLYDNSFHIGYLQMPPFILIIKVETEWCGAINLTTVYQQTIE